MLIRTWAVESAAARQSATDTLAPARELLQAMDDLALHAAGLLELETRFHVALVDVGGNSDVAGDSAIAETVSAAVQRGDFSAAAVGVAAHITGFYLGAGGG
ncbi:MAG: hypothetical protein M3Z00_12600 [Actinomycetota bacterium]|nr:hypothetical protein [Actinomycetota bacterium]